MEFLVLYTRIKALEKIAFDDKDTLVFSYSRK